MSSRHLLLLIAFGPAAIASGMLWRLPTAAAANGAGQGRVWPMAAIALGVAVLALLASLSIGWRMIRRWPRIVAILPVFAALIAVWGRRLAVRGAPEEFYLLDDAKLWIVLLGVSVVLASLLAAAPIDRNRAAVSRSGSLDA
jgi:hypothetical protein